MNNINDINKNENNVNLCAFMFVLHYTLYYLPLKSIEHWVYDA